MTTLKQTYDENGQKRIYCIDPETGIEYINYSDKVEKVVIRAALPEDAGKICKTMLPIVKAISIRSKKPLDEVLEEETKRIRNLISMYDPESPEICFVFERKSNSKTKEARFIAYGETCTSNENSAHAKMNMVFVDSQTKAFYEERLKRAFASMCHRYWLYDGILLVKEDGSGDGVVIYDRSAI